MATIPELPPVEYAALKDELFAAPATSLPPTVLRGEHWYEYDRVLREVVEIAPDGNRYVVQLGERDLVRRPLPQGLATQPEKSVRTSFRRVRGVLIEYAVVFLAIGTVHAMADGFSEVTLGSLCVVGVYHFVLSPVLTRSRR